MKILDYFEPQTEKNILCLGRFDGLHLGHKTLIYKGLEIKNQLNDGSKLAIFLFQRSGAIGRLNSVFTFRETIEKLKDEPIDNIVVAPETQNFYSIDKKTFLDTLVDNFKPTAIICGEDYTFGFNREGDCNFLKSYCEEKGIKLFCLPIVKFKGEKISSTKIKELLLSGSVDKVYELLGDYYFIAGKVEKGRGVGKTIGFPTLNVRIPDEKAPLKEGVYVTLTCFDNLQLTSITNYGRAPTFYYDRVILENHIVCGNYDLYGKDVKIQFVKYLRGTKKFDTATDLAEQIKKDIESI